MTTPNTMGSIIDRLREQLIDRSEIAQESHKAAMHSYGAGYDAGFVAALQEVLTEITGEEP